MNSNKGKFIIIALITLMVLLINTFLKPIIIYNSWQYAFFWLILTVLTIFMYGFRRSRSRFNVDVVQIVIIYSCLYLVATYFSGFILGFVRNPYSYTIIKVISNIIPIIIAIVSQELFRFTIVNEIDDKKYIVGVTLLIALTRILFVYNNYNLSNPTELFSFIGILVIPTINTNILLTYISKNISYIPTIIYRLIFELYIYIIPVAPNLGEYLDTILGTVFPLILFLRLNTLWGKKKPINNRQNKLKTFLLATPITVILITTVVLTSNLFTYYAIAIGSNSMQKKISKGDVVIVKKVKEEALVNLKIGDILVHKHDSRTVVHRIIDIKEINNELIFKTKGDNNNTEDNYEIYENDVVGIVTMKIPYIGMPSVWLSEQIK